MSNTKSSANNYTAMFATISYAYSVASLVSWWLFLVPNDFLPPIIAQSKLYSIELAPKASSVGHASLCNFGSMFVFGFLHSLLARRTVKNWMKLPVSVERSIFCLQGAFCLHMIMHCWREVDSWTVWDTTGFRGITHVALGIFWFGAAFLLSATFALDHFHLFGLSQGFGMDINGALGLAPPKKDKGELVARWHYRLVAHPIMTGMLLNLWATPMMTPSRFVCAGFLTSYILIAVLRFEERTIRDELGSAYDNFLAQRPRFFPKLFPDPTRMIHIDVSKMVSTGEGFTKLWWPSKYASHLNFGTEPAVKKED